MANCETEYGDGTAIRPRSPFDKLGEGLNYPSCLSKHEGSAT